MLRSFPARMPAAIVVGASTGGPQALPILLSQLGKAAQFAPVLVTQHMPGAFAARLADHLARASRGAAALARQGEPVSPGRIYLAPAERHMRVIRHGGVAIDLDDGPPVNFCRPAIDPLFESAARIWGRGALGIVLTGMGRDGLRGARSIVEAGGAIVVQDQASSAVWGMPGSVVRAGLCAAVLPIERIGPLLAGLFAEHSA